MAMDGRRFVGPTGAGRIVDLGPAGACIETDGSLRIGQPYALTLELRGRRRRLRGRVRWCRLVGTRRRPESAESAPVYRAGLSWSPLTALEALG